MINRAYVLKFWAVFFIIQTLGNLWLPTYMVAASGGPDSPEYSSFKSVDVNNLVDPFTGDFSYNLPLLTVPGPNGGYPINLHYNSNIGMEQESSWTGLGWNLNVGAISRQVSGLPDDFSGEELIKRTRYMRPNLTVDLGFNDASISVTGTSPVEQLLSQLSGSAETSEIVGYEDVSVSGTNNTYTLSWNTYKGLGVGYSFNRNEAIQDGMASDFCTNSLGFGIDTNDGMLNISKSFKGMWNSRNPRHARWSFNSTSATGLSIYPRNNVASALFQSSSLLMTPLRSMPASDIPMKGLSIGGEGSIWQTNTTLGGWESTSIGFLASVGVQSIPADKITETFEARGYCYSSNKSEAEDDLTDFILEDPHPMTKRTPILPVPIQTQDSWIISGQGVSGSFRAFRNDVGIFHPPAQKSTTSGGDGGIEIGLPVSPSPSLPSEFKAGVDLGAYSGWTYSGPWTSGNGISALNFITEQEVVLQEQFYFKDISEHTSSSLNEMSQFGDEAPVAFDIGWDFPQSPIDNEGNSAVVEIQSISPRVLNQSNQGAVANGFTDRKIRSKSIQYKTNLEIEGDSEYDDYSRQVYDINNIIAGMTDVPISEFGGQIREFEVVNSNGMRYVYGIPVYNRVKKDVSFRVFPADLVSFDNPSTDDFSDPLVDPYTAQLDPTIISDVENAEYQGGFDHYFSKDEIPEYTTSYLVTEVYSPDYIDLTGDGPTEDDLGYWCKFDYAKGLDYKWQAPYKGVYYNKGQDSNSLDDMASYSYGERESYYIYSIETKTHKAVFHTSEREDNCPVSDELNMNDVASGINDNLKSRKLDQIELFSKNDLSTPIKTVHFEYNYNLCQGVPNNTLETPPTGDTATDNNGGKLTLSKVWFTYQDSEKGSLTPFEFVYSESNPNYSPLVMDRWGTSIASQPSGMVSKSNPFVHQGDDSVYPNRDSDASAWCLTEVHMPSGSWMNIQYEADDYAFVQDKPALQMMEIVATSDTESTLASIDGEQNDIRKDFRRIYFELPIQEPNQNIEDYIGDLDEVYFKTYQSLKLSATTFIEASDYVEGWAALDGDGSPTGGIFQDSVSGIYYGFVDLAQVDLTSIGFGQANPLQLAGWEYLRSERSDLFQTLPNGQFSMNDIGTIAVGIVNTISESVQMFASFYGYAKISQWCSSLDFSQTDRPSFIRLKNPNGRKYGGGSRVAQISFRDDWNENNHYGTQDEEDDDFFNEEYIQIFNYDLADGSSSGVASNEPDQGGEENALRNPIMFNQSTVPATLRGETSFSELPIGQSYFPAPVVGYSRVTVSSGGKSFDDSEITGFKFLGNGKTIHEFFTAKDFPTVTKKTYLSQSAGTMVSKFVPIYIPTVGIQTFQNQGYSQGFVVELNDMHGKLKSTSIFDVDASDDATASTRTEYVYFIEEDNPKRIDNEVKVLNEFGIVEEGVLGQTHDFFVHMAEHHHWNSQGGFQTGVQGLAALVLPSAQIDFEYAYTNFRSVATTKVISKSGILQKVINSVDGSSTESTNLVFDPITGNAILTSTNNEWDAPVYAYSYMGHRYYPGIQPASNNYRAEFSAEVSSQGVLSSAELQFGDFLSGGDELYGPSFVHYWVDYDESAGEYTLLDEEGDVVDGAAQTMYFTVIRSGHRNQHATEVGSVLSLSYVLGQNMLDLVIDGWNTMMQAPNANIQNGDLATGSHFYCQCPGSQLLDFRYSLEETSSAVSDLEFANLYAGGLSECGIIYLDFFEYENPSAEFVVDTSNDDHDFVLTHDGETLFLTDNTDNIVYSCPITIEMLQWLSCLGPACFDVLHASATSVVDEWNLDYSELASTTLENSQSFDNPSSINPYRYGVKGVWRPYRNYVCQTGRSQSGIPLTDISTDGIYEWFVEFDWENESESGSNSTWTRVNELTQYNPQGFAVEEKNALDIHSTQLYGYDNSVTVAVVGNSNYLETGYESFEDHGGNYISPHGHLDFSDAIVSSTQSHTGNYSLKVNSATPVEMEVLTSDADYHLFRPMNLLDPDQSKDYYFSAWVYIGEGNHGVVKARKFDGVNYTTYSTENVEFNPIDGWVQLSGVFNLDPNEDYQIYLESANGGTVYFDDFRIMPWNASMVSYVYDPILLRPVAVLDENNFATLYNYDREGNLVQTKIETIEGVQTISTGRSNIKIQ